MIIFIKHSLRSWWCFCPNEREGAAQPRLDSPLRKTVSCEGLIKQCLSLRHPMLLWISTMLIKLFVSELFTRGLAAFNCPYFAKWETFIVWRRLNCRLNGLRNYQRVPWFTPLIAINRFSWTLHQHNIRVGEEFMTSSPFHFRNKKSVPRKYFLILFSPFMLVCLWYALLIEKRTFSGKKLLKILITV